MVSSRSGEEPDMAYFLRSARRVMTLVFCPGQLHDTPDWDLCSFLRTFEREAGSRLERLCVTNIQSMKPGHVSLRGFPRLHKLQLPLGFFQCIISYAAARVNKLVEDLTGRDVETLEVKLGDLIPASVTEFKLNLIREVRNHGKILNVLFHGFGATKASRLPVLEKVVFDCPFRMKEMRDRNHGCKSASEQLILENEPAGVVFTVNDSVWYNTPEWRGRYYSR